MKYLIVFNHPYEGSYCSSILSSVVSGLAKGEHSIDIINLDKDKFDPVMTSEYLNNYRKGTINDPAVIRYQERIKNAEYIIFIFPIWWEAMPAMMKGWIDKVITKGFAYDVDKTKAVPRFYSLLNHLKGVTLITTMDAPGIVYKLVFGNAIKRILLTGTFRKIGVKNTKWIKLSRINFVSELKRKKWLKEIETTFALQK